MGTEAVKVRSRVSESFGVMSEELSSLHEVSAMAAMMAVRVKRCFIIDNG